MSEECNSCSSGSCSSGSCGSHDEQDPLNKEIDERLLLEERLDKIRHKIVVLSGKGGVGKSTVAINLASALAEAGQSVGLLDIDIHGPSVPKMMGMADAQVEAKDGTIFPVDTMWGLKMMSIAFFMKSADAIIWRGPLKMGVIKQFLRDVDWGVLDYLVVDCPPGTGDEPLSILQLLGETSGAVVVTTPQDIAVDAVRRSISFCRQLNTPILGVVENMSGFSCPDCGKVIDIFGVDGGKKLAEAEKVKFLGAIPISPEMTERGDLGRPVALAKNNKIGDMYRKMAAEIMTTLG